MKKAGVIAASLGTAALLAAGAGAVAHFVTHPGDVIEEANAAELAPPPAREAAAQRTASTPARDGAANNNWGVLGWMMGGADSAQADARQEQTPSAGTRSDDDDDDDDGDDD